MAVQLSNVVPFGRTFDEYRLMFSLRDQDQERSILSVADGPASFNAELTRTGGKVTSIDPIYQFSGSQIEERFNAVVDGIIAQVEASLDDWVWDYHQSPENLKENRTKALRQFLKDYSDEKNKARYVTGSLPGLPFEENSFDLALCSHFLFLYSDHFDLEFHRQSILEMLRIAREVRIFPLLTLAGTPSPYVKTITEELSSMGFQCRIETVKYEFQRGGNKMLKVNS